MNTKRIIALITLLLCSFWLAAQNSLHMFIDYNRFLNTEKKTIFLVDYQIPYRNLLFLAGQNGFFAEVDVQLELYTADSLAFSQQITDNIGIRNKADASSATKKYMNRLSYIMDDPLYNMKFKATDRNSGKMFEWNFLIEALPANSIISDIELNSEVKADTLQYLAKFRRNKVLYHSEPSLLINKSMQDSMFLYFEVYRPEPYNNEKCLLNLSIYKDSLSVMSEELEFAPRSGAQSFSLKIPLKKLKAGKHNGTIDIRIGEISQLRSFDFVLTEEREQLYALMPKADDEYELMRYFLSSQLPTNWKDLDDATKSRYITQFWRNMALNTGRSIPDIMELVKERLDYANKYFGHHKAGWTTDMGRIYIRNGAPDEIIRDTSSDQSRFVRKDYQIWKYSSGYKPVYVFIDIQMSGNFRLIYLEDDDMENSDPDWLRFLGSDFDESQLDN